jgi:hypothetical protein
MCGSLARRSSSAAVSRDLPMPGSPDSSTTWPSPAFAFDQRRSSKSSSSSRPETMPSAAGPLAPETIPLADFQKLTRIPIVIYYGDNFPVEPTAERGQDNWRVRLSMARLWVEAINKHGGDARLVHLPEIGIRGNTHFLFSDLASLFRKSP